MYVLVYDARLLTFHLILCVEIVLLDSLFESFALTLWLCARVNLFFINVKRSILTLLRQSTDCAICS